MSDKKKKKENADKQSTDEAIAKHIISVANLSFQSEMAKDSSLKGLAGQILTCVTILSAAYLMPAEQITSLNKNLGDGWISIVAISYAILLIPLLIALILALTSLDPREATLLSSPLKQFESFSREGEALRKAGKELTQQAISQSYCDALNNEYMALEKKHDRMVSLLKVARGLIIFSVSAAMMCIVVLVSIL